MNSARKARRTKKHRQTRKWIASASVLLLVTIAAVVVFAFSAKNEPASVNNVPNEPTAVTAFKSHYLEIMANLNSAGTRAKMAAQLDPKYNQTDLFSWQST
jgi:flagellar basal body-associated protein FliL